MFSSEVEKYAEKDLRVVPVLKKHCPIKDWLNIDFTEDKEKYQNYGIGLSLGDCDLVVLDIDSLDIKEQREYIDFLNAYPTPLMRQGNPNKLPSRFYAKTWQKGKEKLEVLELLNANAGQASVCVLPPTAHPEFPGVNFKWLGSHSLLNFDLDLLPEFPKEAWDGLKKIRAKYSAPDKTGVTPAQGRCNHGSHNHLSAMAVGHARDGESVDYIASLLLKEDARINPDISYFVCPSRKEFKGNREENCNQFVLEVSRNQIKKGLVGRVEIGEAVIPEIEAAAKTYRKLPRLEGFGKVLFKNLYSNSPIPRSQLCFMNTMNMISIMVGNKFFHRGTACNIYQYGIAPSGYGKDFSFKRSLQILSESGLSHLIGTSSPTSESVIMAGLENQREQCLFINEAEIVLKRITNDRMNFGLRECLTDIYDYGGREHSPKMVIGSNGKRKEVEKLGHIFSPYLNILMTSTVEAFKQYSSENIFNTGFGSRFLFFFEDRFKRQKYTMDFNPCVDSNIKEACRLFSRLGNSYLDMSATSERFELTRAIITPDCEAFYKQMHEETQDEIEANEKNRSQFSALIGRKMLFINKYSGLHHCMVNPDDYETKPMSIDSYKWAREAVDAIIHNMMQHLEENVSDTQYGKLANRVYSYIKKRTIEKSGSSRKDISNAIRDTNRAARRQVLDDLLEQGKIFEKEKLFYAAK